MTAQTKTFSELISFTRASNATYFDSAGVLRRAASNVSRIDYNPSTLAVRGLLVEESRTNLVTYSEDSNNSAWTKTRCSILANITTAPNGSLSADKLVENTDNNTHVIELYASGLTGGATYTQTIFVKAAGRTKIAMGGWDGTTGISCLFNLSTGVVESVGAGTIASSIDSVGSGWYRCRVTRAIAAAATQLSITTYLNNGTSETYAGDGTSGVFIWGAQIEAGAFATSYIPSSVTFSGRTSNGTYFDSTGSLQTAGSGVSRTTYNPSNLTAEPFLLLEESRTNSIRNNTIAGVAAGTPGTLPTYWSNSANVYNGLTQTIVGSGIEKGIPFVDIRYSGKTTAASYHIISAETIGQVAASSGQTWTHSAFITQVGGSFFNLITFKIGISEYSSTPTYLAGVDAGTTFTPENGATWAFSGVLSRNRVSHTRTLTEATTASIYPYITFSYNSGVDVDVVLRIGMPQLELGAYPTSPISTSTAAVTRSADTSTSATATRAADTALITDLVPWFDETEGTVYIETELMTTTARNAAGVDINDGTINNRNIFRAITTGGGDQYLVRSSSSTVATLSSNASAPTVALRKTVISFKKNDFTIVADGSSPSTDTGGEVAKNLKSINLGGATAQTERLCGWIKKVKYYTRRLTNAELQAITR